jgi:hypothetical protein
MVWGCQKNQKNSINKVPCFKTKVVGLNCGGQAVLQILTPGDTIGVKWEDRLHGHIEYDNCLFVINLPEEYRTVGKIMYSRMKIMGKWESGLNCKIYMDVPEKYAIIKSISPMKCDTHENNTNK